MISRKIYMPKSNNTCYPAKYEKFVNLYQDKHVQNSYCTVVLKYDSISCSMRKSLHALIIGD